ncbi:hypothetical protein Q5762_15550 [Streptomyces sp. P9(2023)]|uniref:hypothetical protein n=1 Tax=Streptomyces sp. P9(2023) TaxID=3064394 RepID=UPI0028F42DF5|nr:hypothetical protein [Streptomyces sp. P9(2023)]MDT9689728.1 hypothetical protein [Streptomyces sp. P9(2023)]
MGPVAIPAPAELPPPPTTSEPPAATSEPPPPTTSEPPPTTSEPPPTTSEPPPTTSEPPTAAASLTLDPDHGSVGDPIDVRGTGFDVCSAGTVYLHVVDGPEIASGIPVAENGDFSYTEPIPAETDPDTYTFRAECTDEPSLYADAALVVESPGDPLLTLAEEEGAKGSTVQAEGTGFRCSNVDLLWDGAEPSLATAPVTEQATFATEIPVPSDAEPGAHTVRAVCQDYPEQYGEASYEVTDEPGPTNPNPTDPNPTDPNQTDPNPTAPPGTTGGDGGGSTPVVWVVGPASLGGALALAAAAAVYFGRLHRGPRWVRNHVRATLRPATGDTALIEYRPPGEPPTRTTRLDPHPDPGRQTLDEEDR